MNKQLWPKPKKQPRNKKTGEYQRRSIMPYVSMAVVVVFVACIAKYGALKEEYVSTHVANAAVLDDGVEPITQADIDAKKDKLVEDIGSCESGFVKEPDAAIVFDTNNEASLGHLQFQVKTVQAYVKLFEGRKINRLEAITIAHDHQQSHDLAKKIVFEDSKGWKNWFNCGNKVHADATVNAIKSLEKKVSI